MKIKLLLIAIVVSTKLFGQIDTAFFPTFTPYDSLPILEFGDLILGAGWNDPCVIKEGINNYVMYASAATTGIDFTDSIKIYRMTSSDGYTWSLNPTSPVLKPILGTYYQGGVETPSVIKLNGTYHMYNTVYPTFDEPDITKFKIAHSTSSDGINWTTDSSPFLVADPNTPWMEFFVSEPGAMIKNDTIYVFFTAGGSTGKLSIGLVRTLNGDAIIDTLSIVSLPTDVYPLTSNYEGLSTPSATMVGDTIYLFTDVMQIVLSDSNTQVALHQFKSYGDLSKWYHSSVPIHTKDDFTWTDGNNTSQLLAPTPLYEGNKLRLWYSGFNVCDIDTVLNDTTCYVHPVGSELHIDSGHWGIGTSEYTFSTITGITDEGNLNEINIYPNPATNSFTLTFDEINNSSIQIFNLSGQVIYSNKMNSKTLEIDTQKWNPGIYFLQLRTSDGKFTTKKLVIE